MTFYALHGLCKNMKRFIIFVFLIFSACSFLFADWYSVVFVREHWISQECYSCTFVNDAMIQSMIDDGWSVASKQFICDDAEYLRILEQHLSSTDTQ